MANNKNRLVSDHMPSETIDNAVSVLAFMNESVESLSVNTYSENAATGFHLLLDCVEDALKHASKTVHDKYEERERKVVNKGVDNG